AISEGVNSLLVRGNVDKRIAEVFAHFNINPEIEPSKSKCSKCNGELIELKGTDKERVKDLVFEQTYNFYDTFWLCEDCQSVFFEGSHWKNMRKYIIKISSLMKQDDVAIE
ncbi:MAG: Mut7-C RNAse domain-containing protein, partial [Candidatus Thorarchaeota archaeon]